MCVKRIVAAWFGSFLPENYLLFITQTRDYFRGDDLCGRGNSNRRQYVVMQVFSPEVLFMDRLVIGGHASRERRHTPRLNG